MQFSAPRIVTGVCVSPGPMATWPRPSRSGRTSLRARRTLTARAFVHATML